MIDQRLGNDAVRRGEVPYHGRHDDAVLKLYRADISRA